MSSVDDRIVNMQFNNKQFTAGVTETKKQLEDLEHTLANTAKSGGLKEMGSSVDHVSSRFDALKVAGITAVATIAHKVTEAGISLVKSMSVDPILAGFREYELNLKSVQTIMANTGESIETTNKFLKQLNEYSDKTVYNFGQMASAIGRFTAAGVELPQATSAIKGMANVAALTGADANQLNVAMYQMSQALAAGTIRLMDWRSLENANMGTENMRVALQNTALAMGEEGEAMEAAMKKHGNFRDSLTEGWLSAEVFTKTMKVMAGTVNEAGDTVAFTVKELRGMGYSKQAAQELNRLSAASIDSATKIKTFTQMIDVIKESIGSGWAQVFQNLFGNLTEASNLWTTVGNKITGSIGGMFDSFNSILTVWKEAGGYEALWNGFGNIFQALGNIIRPFIVAFQTLFPSTGKAGEGLADLSKGFETFTGWIEVATRGMDVLTPVLVAVAQGFKMVGTIIGVVIEGLKPFAPMIRNAANALGELVSQGTGIGAGILQGLVAGLDPAAIQAAVFQFAQSVIDWIKQAFGIHSPSTEMIAVGYDIAAGLAEGIVEGAKLIGKVIGLIGENVMQGFQALFGGMNSLDFAALLNTLITGMFLYAATQFTKTLSSVAGILDQVGASLKAWQTGIKAQAILNIAIAIGILAASLVLLSFLDPKELAIGLGAISAMMGTLTGTLLALSKINSDLQIAVLAASIALIAGAMVALAVAVTILGQQDPKNVAAGLGFMAIALGIVTTAVLAMSGITGQLVAAGAAIFIISNALIVLSGAVLAFGMMDMDTLAKGLGAIAVALMLIVPALMLLAAMGPGVFAASAAILVVASAMVVLSGAVLAFGSMDMETLAKGLGAMAIGLAIVVASLVVLALMAPQVAVAAAAILIVSAAMVVLATAVGIFGSMDMGTLAKGFAAVAVGLLLILGAAFLAQAVAPGLLVLGVTFQLLGQAMALAGVGMFLFATGFALLAAVGVAGVAVLSAAIMAFITLLPQIAIQIAAAFVAFFEVIANSSEQLRAAFGQIFQSLIGVISDNIPLIGALFRQLIAEGIRVLSDAIPRFVELGFTIIDRFLISAEAHIPSIADSVSKLIVSFIEAFDRHLQRIITAGKNLIINFLEGLGKAAAEIATAAGEVILDVLDAIDDAIVTYGPQIRQKGIDIIGHLVDGMTGGLASKAGEVAGAVGDFVGGVIPGRMAVGMDVGFGFLRKSQVQQSVDTAVAIANAIISEGNDKILKAQQEARKKERIAAKKDAKADIANDAALAAEKYAKKHKKDKQAQKEAKKLRRLAEEERKKADKADQAYQAAQAKVQRVREFEQADLGGKGDIKSQQAQDLATKANQMLARANEEAAEARELMKTNKKAGRELLEQAKKDRKAAKKLAEDAKKANAAARKFYADEVQARIDQIKADQEAEEKTKAEEKELEEADTAGKVSILSKRAEENEKKAAKLKAEAEALIKKAEAKAATDAIAAMKLLDQAEKAAEEAEAAANLAEQQKDQVEQLLSGGAGGGAGGGIGPSRSVLEDAASAVDRYTASLAQATALAAAEQAPVQFVQNNYSPQALSTSQIYRQSKNLLSNTELKMGVTTTI